MSGSALSIVVPVHNGAALLGRQLDALRVAMQGAGDSELIVVDNRSSDDSAEIVRRWSASTGVTVRVVAAHARAGEPYARNVGLEAADGELLAFCDADDEVGPTWIAGMVEGLAEADYLTGPVKTERLNEPWQRSSRTPSPSDRPPSTIGGVPFANGCNMGFRRGLLKELGGFDETFLIGCDIEIGVRAWKHGTRLEWADRAAVDYRLRTDLGGMFKQARAYGRAHSRIAPMLIDCADPADARRTKLRRAAWLLRRSPLLMSKETRARWVWVAGQLEGSLHGVPKGAA